MMENLCMSMLVDDSQKTEAEPFVVENKRKIARLIPRIRKFKQKLIDLDANLFNPSKEGLERSSPPISN
jgi:hypothetical protein